MAGGRRLKPDGRDLDDAFRCPAGDADLLAGGLDDGAIQALRGDLRRSLGVGDSNGTVSKRADRGDDQEDGNQSLVHGVILVG